MIYKGLTQLDIDKQEKQRQIDGILLELEKLSIEVPRIVEDIVSQSNIAIDESKQKIIDRKNELRLQLKQLQGELNG